LNQTEKRRQKLLEYTRNLYTDRRTVPAVHPRYKTAYYHVYEEENTLPKSNFGVRFLISILLFMCYVIMKQNQIQIFGMNNLHIIDIIVHNFQI